jgi:hypothetical protein
LERSSVKVTAIGDDADAERASPGFAAGLKGGGILAARLK